MGVTDLEPPAGGTLVRGVLWPGWLAAALAAVPFAAGVAVPLEAQLIPLAVSVVAFGLPHGAVDHLALPRVRGRRPTRRAMGAVGALYLALGAVYALGWLLAPAAAFVGFVLLTWGHWGQGDLHALLALAGADHLRTPAQRALAVVVRGGLPMLVPLLSFPGWYRRVAAAIVSLFGLGSAARLSWVFATETRLALGAAYAAVVLAHLALGYARAGDRRPLLIDAGETGLLAAYFVVVPPLIAIGLYFCLWHSLRHVARLVLLEPDSRRALERRRLGPALARFAREAAPLTLAALALLGGVYLLVPDPPADPLGWIGLYLVLIAVLTLPHVVVVTAMDREQGIWSPG